MSLADEIRNEIENIKELKITVGDINNHLSVLEGLTRKDIEEQEKEAYQRGFDDAHRISGEEYQRGLAEGKKAFDLLDAERDTEYQKGFEDGKESTEKGCEGCKYHEDTSLTNPCSECTRAWKDHYTPAPHSDRIEVGDEVKQITTSGTETGVYCVVTRISGDSMSGFSPDGHVVICGSQVEKWWTKTGKHYDIQSILEAMKS